jgi:hypothetical protein
MIRNLTADNPTAACTNWFWWYWRFTGAAWVSNRLL